MAINANQFQNVINSLLDEYGDEVMENASKCAYGVAKESAKKLKQKSTGKFEDRTGDYRRSWSAKLENKRLGFNAIAYNKEHYRLTHLLEKGHAIKKNGVKVGEAQAFPHIEDVDKWASEEFPKRLKEILEK